MNKNLLFILGSFILGGGIGFMLGWKIAKRECEVELLEARADAEYFGKKSDDLIRSKNSNNKNVEKMERELNLVYEAMHSLLESDMEEKVKDLVRYRMTIKIMQDEGADEETISEYIIWGEGYNPGNMFGDNENDVSNWDEIDDEPAIQDDFIVTEQVVEYEEPYLISEEEYCDNDRAYDQIALTYFSADDTLCDTDDDTIDQDNLGVTDLLLEFARTDDPSIFIRDETKCVEYEIIWDDGAYQTVVLGMNPEALILLPRIFRNGE